MPEFRENFGRPDFMAGMKNEIKNIEEEGKRKIRAQKREVAEKRSKEIVAEQEKVVGVLKRLYETVYQNPDKATPELIMDFVQQNYDTSLPPEVTQKLAGVLEKFKEKRQAVLKFLRENKDPKAMFKKCFGTEPKGKVEIIPGPMTVCFRCFDDSDYMAAYLHSEVPGEDAETKAANLEQLIDRLKPSLESVRAAAFYNVKTNELPPGCIIAERVKDNFQNKPIYRKKEFKISGREKNTWQHFPYPTPKESNLIYFKVPVVGEVEAYFTRNPAGTIVIAELSTHDSEGHPRLLADLDVSLKEQRVKIPVPVKQYAAEEWVELEFSREGFAMFDHTKAGAGYETVEHLGNELVIKDKELSKGYRLHEEQHQFNKLYSPENMNYFSLAYSEFRRLDHFLKKHPDIKPAAMVAHKFAEIYRNAYIDNRARDEIIAYLRDGTAPDKIFEILSKSPTYDYRHGSVTLQNGNKTTWKNFFKTQVKILAKTLVENGTVAFNLPNGTHSVVLEVFKPWAPEDYTQADLEVEYALTVDYEKKLKRWTTLIEHMQRAGYENRDIVAFLNILPINRWYSAIRRLLKSKKARPIDMRK